MENIEHVSFPFSFAKLQEFLTILDYTERKGIAPDQIRAYVRARNRVVAEVFKDTAKREREWKQRAPKCPECGASLLLRRIGFPPGRGNSNGYKSEWYCSHGDCIYEKFSTATVEEELDKYGLKNIGSRFVRRCNQEK